jgi:hypothetical protein
MREFKKPDVTAPRFRPAVYNVLNKEFFESFKKKYSKYKDLDNLDLKNIIKKFNYAVYNKVIDVRDGIQLPESIGWLFIGTCQQSKKQNINYAKSLKYGVSVSNNNWETDGKLAKIFFTNHAPKHKIKNREFWGFTACRNFKRTVAKTYPENWNMYIVVDATKKLNLTYSNTVYRDRKNKEADLALKQYNDSNL